MMRRLLLTFTLALMFGLGQQAMLAHAISHGINEQQNQGEDHPSDTLSACAQCLAYANLANAIPSTDFVMDCVPCTLPAHALTASSASFPSDTYFLARAPPHVPA